MARFPSLVLVGSETLIAREIRDVLAERPLPAELKVIASKDEEAGTLTEVSGTAAIIGRPDADSLGEARAIFLAAGGEVVDAARKLSHPPVLIDLTYAYEDDPEARVRAPAVESSISSSAVNVIAHPAAIAIALFLRRLHSHHRIQRSIVHIFEPASERGVGGLEELQEQTINLLSFKGVPKKIFDAQVSFNMLASYGEEAPIALQNIELRIERHLATLLAREDLPMPSLRLIQAPVFHGHSYSLWVEFEANPGVAELEEVLSAEGIDVRASDLEPPNTVGIVGQSGIAIGAIQVDRNEPRACWFWMVADNLRLAAENAVEVAREVL